MLRFELGEQSSEDQAAQDGPGSEEEIVRAFMDELDALELAQDPADDNEVEP